MSSFEKLDFNPPIRKNYAHLFPKQFATQITREDFSKCKTFFNDSLTNAFQELSLEQYLKNFEQNPAHFDLHEINFQNFSLKLTAGMNNKELISLSNSKEHSKKRILRARVYAISTRDDLSWNGDVITNSEEKSIEDIWLSCILYDWKWSTKDDFEQLEKLISNSHQTCTTEVLPLDTQQTVEILSKRYPTQNIAWLNLANAHNTVGSYNVAYGGSQEEHVATNCTAAATLGLNAFKITKGFREWAAKGEHHIVYIDGKHIPPGGNYFCKTKFITSDNQIECYMIAAAFADFRNYIPIFISYSERPYYFSMLGYGNKVSDRKKLENRLIIDIEGVLLTAIKEKMDVLILGASGCGAFCHDADLEAKLWNDAIKKYENCFTHIVFAILPDKRRPENVKAFEKYFSKIKSSVYPFFFFSLKIMYKICLFNIIEITTFKIQFL